MNQDKSVNAPSINQNRPKKVEMDQKQIKIETDSKKTGKDQKEIWREKNWQEVDFNNKKIACKSRQPTVLYGGCKKFFSQPFPKDKLNNGFFA